VASILTCSIHYFGILSLMAGVAVVLIRRRHSIRDTARRMLPALAGPAALLAFIPLYVHQRSALSAPTWIPSVTVGGVLFLLMVLLLPPSTVAAVAFAGLEKMRPVRDRPATVDATSARDQRGGFGSASWLLIGQVTVPITLALISLLGEPLTQPRYWIVGAFSAAPIASLAMVRLSRPLAAVVAFVTVAWSVVSVRREAEMASTHARRVREDVEIVSRAAAEHRLVVIRRRHTLYPVLRERPDLLAKTALLDATSAHPTDRFLAVERDVARVHAAAVGFPRMVTPADVASLSSLYVVEYYADRRPTAAEFPHHAIRAVSPRVFMLERQ
jgi:hypothetical protein